MTGILSHDRYSRRTGIIETDLGAELILLDPTTEEMFSLNDVGRLVWRELDEAPIETIVDRVVGAFDVGYEVAASDVRALLDQLLRAGLAVTVR
ncbi:MAG TPA: PqqD family protein [Gemmatimonadaceae bacterium]|nr:PqqD family protein [Gemmatimonadaceae bacterium]